MRRGVRIVAVQGIEPLVIARCPGVRVDSPRVKRLIRIGHIEVLEDVSHTASPVLVEPVSEEITRIKDTFIQIGDDLVVEIRVRKGVVGSRRHAQLVRNKFNVTFEGKSVIGIGGPQHIA